MRCHEIRKLVSLPGEETLLPADERHLRECADCSRFARRTRRLARALEGLPRQDAPDGLALADAWTISQARSSSWGAGERRRDRFAALMRVAAMLLLLAGGPLVFLLARSESTRSGLGTGYRPLEIQVVDVRPNGALDEAFALDEHFGPDAVMLLAVTRNASGNALGNAIGAGER